MNYQQHHRGRKYFRQLDRNLIVLIIFYLITAVLIVRLFSLQVISYNYYKQIATKEHYGYSELPAYRGEIFIKDYGSGENIRVATNSTLDLLYADPVMIKNKKLVADRIVPIIYNQEEAKKADRERVKQSVSRAKTAEDIEKAKAYSDDDLYKNFYNDFLDKISSDTRPMIIVSSDLDQQKLDQIRALNLPGIEITENNELRAYPPQINNFKTISQQLGTILETPPLQLENLLHGQNRYVVLMKKMAPEISVKIKEIMANDEGQNFIGLGLQEEYYRYYPEKTLAANVLGFVDQEDNGTYGIEDKFNTELKGRKGIFETQKDSIGRLITVGDSLIQPAEDGQNITLTIDRSIQLAVERKLERAVKGTRADSGQILIMDPKTGKIIALAHYPSFDPNDYGSIYEKEDVNLTEDEIKNLVPIETMENTFWLYYNVAAQDRTMIFKNQLPDGTVVYQKYKNKIGPEAYQNKVVSAPYEPGSVFKTISMSIAIDDGDVTPGTIFNDPGVLDVDEYHIKNVSQNCTGRISATQILAFSCNTGIGRIAQLVGRNLFYSYMIRFGFGERTEIEFANEHPGQLAHFNQWAESELVTHAFGQGFTVTLIQMGEAISAIANKGVMMQPYIVESIEKSPGNFLSTEPIILGQIIKSETADLVKNMMVGAVENGVAIKAKLDNYYIAGKTGTSQTYKYGKPLTGAGTTIATMGGFGPINDPKFVILIKFDRPRSSEWADSTVAPLFKDVAAFLYDYYSIPPDKK
jgi:cell division protein FtsI/penicillin-binding protein 2